MSICDIKINNDITSPCSNPLYTGKKQKGWLINRDDVASYTLTGNYVTGITLVTGAQAYFIECNEKRPYQGTITAMEDGDTQNTFAHTVLCHMANDGADFRTNVIEKLAGGRFVVILENLWGGENNDSFFPVYGLQRGLDCVAETTENVDNGGWDFTLAETGLPMAGLYYWHTDEETSRNDLDALAGGGGGEDWTPKWFYVEDASGAANTLTIKKSNNALANKVFEWSTDKATWTEITITDTTGVSLAVPANGRVYLRGNNGVLASSSSYNLYMVASGLCKVGGDISTLLYIQGSVPIADSYAVYALFGNMQNKLIDAQDLVIPFYKVGESGCSRLFFNCTALTNPCKMPNIANAAKSLFSNMYGGCTALTNVMILPKTLIGSTTNSMFAGMYSSCTTLIDGGTIPNITQAGYCFNAMFQHCTNLARIEVYANTWNTANSQNWLDGVSPTGDFYNLGGATIPTGTNGIPSGWTEHTALP